MNLEKTVLRSMSATRSAIVLVILLATAATFAFAGQGDGSRTGQDRSRISPIRRAMEARAQMKELETLKAAAEQGTAAGQFVPLTVELNRIMLDERPVILRFAPDHGETTATLQRLGLNAVWVQDYRATQRAADLRDLGLAVLATPPHPEFEPGDYSRLLRALPPLDQLCPSTSAW